MLFSFGECRLCEPRKWNRKFAMIRPRCSERRTFAVMRQIVLLVGSLVMAIQCRPNGCNSDEFCFVVQCIAPRVRGREHAKNKFSCRISGCFRLKVNPEARRWLLPVDEFSCVKKSQRDCIAALLTVQQIVCHILVLPASSMLSTMVMLPFKLSADHKRSDRKATKY